jgi:hypothetical protein
MNNWKPYSFGSILKKAERFEPRDDFKNYTLFQEHTAMQEAFFQVIQKQVQNLIFPKSKE